MNHRVRGQKSLRTHCLGTLPQPLLTQGARPFHLSSYDSVYENWQKVVCTERRQSDSFGFARVYARCRLFWTIILPIDFVSTFFRVHANNLLGSIDNRSQLGARESAHPDSLVENGRYRSPARRALAPLWYLEYRLWTLFQDLDRFGAR